jgi:pyruvate dehydrogenase E2 component (dihydrolipoamide acetyltransferase)
MMAHEFRLPDIGEGLTEAEIVRWHVAVGDTVKVDETVVEVETDKAVVEIPSPFGGVVLFHGAREGQVLPVGEILVVVGDPGEVWGSGEAGDAAGASETDGEDDGQDAAPIVGTISSSAVDLTPSQARPAATGPILALPVVRKLARDLGVDLAGLTGSGPNGRVTRDDVLAAAAAATGGPPAVRDSSPQPEHPLEETVEEEAPTVEPGPAETSTFATSAEEPVESGSDERRPLSRLRRTIAANMSRSWSEIPHVTTFDHVDASRLLQARAALASRHGSFIPLEAMVVAAVVPALRAFPSFNATLDGDDLVVHGRHDVGVAVDTPDGLMVAVIAAAGSRSLLELAGEVVRLGEGAKARTLEVGELSGQTFTVSNIGAVGGGLGTPIVPHGTTSILSVGRAVDTPVARDGRVEIAPMMPLSLSYDHRVIDGAMGRRFMAMVMENLQEPALFLA